MKTKCKKECPKYNLCSLCLCRKECHYPEYNYLEYNWFEKLINKITHKNDTNKNDKEKQQNNSSICTVDQNKSECSLIDELRELQNKRDKLLLKNKRSSIGIYPFGYYHYIYGIRINGSDIDKEKAFKLLKDAIIEEEIYLKNEKEIEKMNNRIKEIKQQLGIK